MNFILILVIVCIVSSSCSFLLDIEMALTSTAAALAASHERTPPSGVTPMFHGAYEVLDGQVIVMSGDDEDGQADTSPLL